MKNFESQLKLRIDWSEMDLFGHVNNVAYFKYIQASRVHYWEQIGLTQMHQEQNRGPVLASTSCQFKKPLFYPGNILIKARVGFIKNSSFSIEHQVWNDQNELAAIAEDVVVMFDFNTHQKITIPEYLAKAIQVLKESQSK